MKKRSSFHDEESRFQGHYSSHALETLRFAYLPVMRAILFFMAVGLLSRLLLLSNANIIGIWVDRYCQTLSDGSQCRPVPNLFANFSNSDFLYLLSGMTVVGFLCTGVFRIGFSRLSAEAISRLYDEVTLRTSRFSIRFFDTNPVGRIVTRFSSDYGAAFRLFGGPLAEFLSIIFDLTSMFILVTVASPYFVPVFIVIAGLNYFVYRLNRNRIRRERRALSESRSPSIAHFAETTQGASAIRIFGRQKTFADRFAELDSRFLRQRLSTAKVALGFSLQMGVLTATLLLSTGIVGYWLLQRGLVSVGSIGVAFAFIIMSGTSMQMFFDWMAQFEEAMTGVERLDHYLRSPLEAGARLPSSREFMTMHPTYTQGEEASLKVERLVADESAEITVRDLWFRYSSESPYVLKGLNFVVRPGEKVGVVGRTGSGKTSFVQALFHLYPIDKGVVEINGKAPRLNINETTEGAVDLGLFRRSISLISQEPTLFRGSIRENLDFSKRFEDGALLDALERVGLKEWLAEQSEGLDSRIEERGRNLSAGEKQLLCMARCVLQEAPIVVMDEATSSIDPQSEEILVRATKEFFSNRTQIIIAHRLSTLEHCDRILWLQKGEVHMFDSPEKVLPIFDQAQLA